MATKCLIRPSEYHDSVTLMEIARELAQLPGVDDSAVVMATQANKAILREAGLLLPEIETATAIDLVVAVKAEDGAAADHALEVAQGHLARRPWRRPGPSSPPAMPPRRGWRVYRDLEGHQTQAGLNGAIYLTHCCFV